MRYFIFGWLLPVGGLAAWLYLAQNDISFGTMFFSRDMFDMVFGLYAQVLGVDAETLPPMIYKALVVDTLIIGAIFAFRRRKQIMGWWKARGNPTQLQDRINAIAATGPVHPAE